MQLNVYLNFPGTTEAAFEFYRAIFGGEFNVLMRFGDMDNADELDEAVRDGITHVSLDVGGILLMGTDVFPGVNGEALVMGDNVSLSLSVDSRGEADRLYAALAEGGVATTPMADMFWGDYWGQLVDRFGVQWMLGVGKAS